MSHPTIANLPDGLQSLLVLGVMLLGLAVIFRGVGVIGWLLSGIARLLAPLVGVLIRGLVILTILGVLYLLVATKLAELHQSRGAGSDPVTLNPTGIRHDDEH